MQKMSIKIKTSDGNYHRELYNTPQVTHIKKKKSIFVVIVVKPVLSPTCKLYGSFVVSELVRVFQINNQDLVFIFMTTAPDVSKYER